MRLTLFLLFIALFKTNANSYSQRTKVSMDLNNVTVSEVFDTLTETTDFKLLYMNDEIDLNRKVSVKVKKERVEKVLYLVFADTPIAYEVVDKQIILRHDPRKGIKKASVLPAILEDALAFQERVSGTVKDENGVPLMGATVVEKGTNNGTTTDFDGRFSINVTQGATLEVSYVGYKKKEVAAAGTGMTIQLDPDAEQLSEVVVEGYRASFQRANQAKRKANRVVDVISAEDVGKLPDPNIAEALQRVTGVQIQRDNAAGAFVSIRGLDPTFTKVTINGQSQTAARSRAGDTGFNLSVLGSSVASSLEVIKSPTPDMEEGGVGGTVNIKKLRPFDIGETKLTLAAKPVYEVEAEAVNPRFEAFFNTMLNDKLGVSLNAFYFDRDFERTRVRGESSPETVTLADGSEAFVQDRIRPRLNRDNDKNLSLASTIQYKFNDKVNAYVDLTYGRVKGFDTRYDADIRYRTSHVVPNAVETNETGFGTSVGLRDFRSLGFGGFTNNTEDELFSAALGLDVQLSEKTHLLVEGARSFNRKTNDDLPGFGGSLGLGEGGVFDPTPENPDDVIAELSFGNPTGSGVLFTDLLGIPSHGDINNYYLGSSLGSSGTLEETEAKEYSVRADFTTKISDNFFESIKYGAKYTQRTESETNIRRELIDRTPPSNVADYLTRITEYNDNDILPGFEYYGVNVRPFVKDAFSDPSKYVAKTGDAGDEMFAERKIFSVYQMANIGGGEKRYRGNFGIRWVYTNTTTKGFAAFGGDRRLEINPDGSVDGFEEQTVENKYLEVLPSMNFAYDISDRLVARMGAGRVMRRPEIREMSPYFELRTDRDELTDEVVLDPDNTDGEAGNPELDPFVANQLDVSLEYYLKGGGIISGGVFFKDVQNFITDAIEARDVQVLDPNGNPETLRVGVETFVNGGGATVKGFELAYNQQFTFLPGFLSGLGTSLNYTFTDSEAHETGLSLDGTSKNSFNATIFYEQNNWGVRFAHNYRDEYRNGNEFRKPIGLWDGSAYVDLLEDKLKLTFNVVNIGNKPFLEDVLTDDLSRDYNGSNFSDYEFAGRQYLLGVIYNVF
ncbi:TonB-dependent receptor [Sediminicola luteus]|nr:TonB-dependent receptor [Sediminicola luteus]